MDCIVLITNDIHDQVRIKDELYGLRIKIRYSINDELQRKEMKAVDVIKSNPSYFYSTDSKA